MPKIKQLRKSQNLNAMELVEKAGLDLNQPLMSAVESGKVLFTPDDLQAVCETLQCTPMDLYNNPDEFDLMAVQRKLGASVKPVPDYSKPQFTDNEWKFADMPPPNPKRSFRMSDEDWDALTMLYTDLGYKSLGAYLKACIRTAWNKQA